MPRNKTSKIKTHKRIISVIMSLVILMASFAWDGITLVSQAAVDVTTKVALDISFTPVYVPVIDKDINNAALNRKEKESPGVDATTKKLIFMTVHSTEYGGYRECYCIDHGKGFRSNKDVYSYNQNTIGSSSSLKNWNDHEKETLMLILRYGYKKDNAEYNSAGFDPVTINESYKVFNFSSEPQAAGIDPYTRATTEYMATQALIWILAKDVWNRQQGYETHYFPNSSKNHKYSKNNRKYKRD